MTLPAPELPPPNPKLCKCSIIWRGEAAFPSPDDLIGWATAYARPLLAQLAAAREEVERLTLQRDGWGQDAAQYARNADYYRDLLNACAKHIGLPAYTADDQGVHPEPLRAKIPECVEAIVREVAELKAKLEAAQGSVAQSIDLLRRHEVALKQLLDIYQTGDRAALIEAFAAVEAMFVTAQARAT